MNSFIRVLIILSLFFGTIFICANVGNIVQAQRHDVSGLTSAGISITGVMGAVTSLVVGVVVSFLLRHKNIGYLSLLGYIIPNVITILLCVLRP